jgi:hypothetical protein
MHAGSYRPSEFSSETETCKSMRRVGSSLELRIESRFASRAGETLTTIAVAFRQVALHIASTAARTRWSRFSHHAAGGPTRPAGRQIGCR